MSYNEFKIRIEKLKKVSRTEYENLCSSVGTQKINNYFERYLSDETIEDNEKINKTKYYVNHVINKEKKIL